MSSGGLQVRSCREEELRQVAELLVERGNPADSVDVRLVASDPDEGLGSIGVAVDGDRVVATATLLRETLVVDDLALPAGQVELVASAPSHEHQGLVRRLMAWAHRASAERGDLAQVMIGIPSFYKHFGYAYAMRIPRRYTLQSPLLPPTPMVTVREARTQDIRAMAALQAAAQAVSQVRVPRAAAGWRWVLARTGSRQLVAERDGVVIATARLVYPPDQVVVGELAGDRAGLSAILARAQELAYVAGQERVEIAERPGVEGFMGLEAYLIPPTGRAAQYDEYYARIPDVPRMLTALAPVLQGRLGDAGLGDRQHQILLSWWSGHVRFDISGAEMSSVVQGGPFQAPVANGGSGVPWEALPALFLGPDGARGLEFTLPDCLLGEQFEVMDALFPPLQADLLTFYLPV